MPIIPGRNGRTWRRLAARVVAEEDTCGICGEWVDRSLSGRDAMGPSVNHKRPLSQGGDPYDRANLELAHLGCNSSRKDRLAEPVRSRDW